MGNKSAVTINTDTNNHKTSTATVSFNTSQTSNAHMIISEKPNYIALFDYESATKDDMTIKKNDQKDG